MFITFKKCRHQFDVIDKIKVNYDNEFSGGSYFLYVLMCKNCGKIRKVRVD